MRQRGIYLDPIVLYATVTGKSIDELLAGAVVRSLPPARGQSSLSPLVAHEPHRVRLTTDHAKAPAFAFESSRRAAVVLAIPDVGQYVRFQS